MSKTNPPIMQNPLSGECGVMAVVNAFRVLLPDIYGSAIEYEALMPCEHLYNAVIAAIPTRSLKPFIREGSDDIRGLVSAGYMHTRAKYNASIRIQRWKKNQIQKAPMAKIRRCAWIVGLQDHWTVICHEHENGVFEFYDSYAPDQLRKRGVKDVMQEIEKLYTIEVV